MGAAPAVRRDVVRVWAACESVQRAGPHFSPGPFAPNEDAVARLARLVSNAYLA